MPPFRYEIYDNDGVKMTEVYFESQASKYESMSLRVKRINLIDDE